jgi:DNA invertase Pin-like site-specific DNA recombinase
MSKRFAFYGRLSTVDKQDQSLARPSQLKACQSKAAELDGEVMCEFFDQESGAKDERPGWTALTQEARDRERRRFDAVVIYQTRERFLAGLYERELRKVGVPIHYAVGGGDPDTPEGMLAIGVQQLIDEFERKRLARETKRGMRENALQGFRNGGRAPFGYRRELEAHSNPMRAQSKDKRYYCCDYARSYRDEAAAQIPEHGKWLYVREDVLLPLVERFFAERIFGPMRLDKLERQLRAHGRQAKRTAKHTESRLRGQVADLERRIGLQIDALEKGLEPELVGRRIGELRAEKEEAEATLRELGADAPEADSDEVKDTLGRLPDLSEALHKAPLVLKRQVFEAFCLQIRYDKVERRIEISATVTEVIAKAFEKTKDLPQEVSRVALRDIAGAGFEPATFGL